MRKHAPSKGEVAAWKQLRLLRAEGFAFRREHNLGAYYADFVCLRRKVIVEVDGGVHALPGAAEHDAKRDAWLSAEGFKVMRFSDKVILSEAYWLDDVRRALRNESEAPYRRKSVLSRTLPLEGGGQGRGESVARDGAETARGEGAFTASHAKRTLPLEGGGQGGGESVGRDGAARDPGSEPSHSTPSPSPNPLPSREGAFWKTKTLSEMSEPEWESLCDGCGKCCLIGLEDEDSGEIYLTDVACKLFDSGACQCSDYTNRQKRVTDCVKLTPENVPTLNWLPKTCAYRLVSEKRDLFWWHPLVSGDPDTVHQANVSVMGKTRPEGRLQIPGLMKRITKWPKPKDKPPAPSNASKSERRHPGRPKGEPGPRGS